MFFFFFFFSVECGDGGVDKIDGDCSRKVLKIVSGLVGTDRFPLVFHLILILRFSLTPSNVGIVNVTRTVQDPRFLRFGIRPEVYQTT